MGLEDSRLRAIKRTLQLVEDLRQGREHDRNSAAELLGIEPAAANRQLAAIAEVLSGVRVGRTRPARTSLKAPRRTDPPPLGAAIAACIGSSIASLFESTVYGEGARQSTKRIIRDVQRASDFQDFDRKFVFHAQGGEHALPAKHEELDEIIEAVLKSRWLELRYVRYRGKSEQLRIKPLSVLVYAHQLYVLGEDAAGTRHPYRFSRMRKVDALKRTFEYPARGDYDPRQLWRDSLGVFLDESMPIVNVRVRLDAGWRTYVETHRWHHSQRFTPMRDGSIVVQMRVRHCPELERWVLGFGEEAEVLAPVELRERVSERLVKASARYAIP